MSTLISERRVRRRDSAAAEPLRLQLETMILGTYHEMPGLTLDMEDAARLFGLKPTTCQIVLGDLLRKGVLRRGHAGMIQKA
jgi:hypothetical protein